MRFKTLVAAGVAVLAMTSGAAGGAQARTSIWDGVYSDAQATRGHTLYMQNCARCHGVNLSGTYEIPPLVGRFMPYWSGSTWMRCSTMSAPPCRWIIPAHCRPRPMPTSWPISSRATPSPPARRS